VTLLQLVTASRGGHSLRFHFVIVVVIVVVVAFVVVILCYAHYSSVYISHINALLYLPLLLQSLLLSPLLPLPLLS
jgi:hypothetical protein